MLKISFKRTECVGCGNCVDISPNLWIMDQNDGLASLIGSEQKKGLSVLYTEEFEERMFQNAATVCPVKIIHVEKLII